MRAEVSGYFKPAGDVQLFNSHRVQGMAREAEGCGWAGGVRWLIVRSMGLKSPLAALRDETYCRICLLLFHLSR